MLRKTEFIRRNPSSNPSEAIVRSRQTQNAQECRLVARPRIRFPALPPLAPPERDLELMFHKPAIKSVSIAGDEKLTTGNLLICPGYDRAGRMIFL